MATYQIKIVPEKCTGCLRCQLACSERHTKIFNPSVSRIQILNRGVECSISFTDECTGCGTCVEQCFYGALLKKPGEVMP